MMVRSLRDDLMARTEARAAARGASAEAACGDAQEALTEELEERLRKHWPRKGRTEVHYHKAVLFIVLSDASIVAILGNPRPLSPPHAPEGRVTSTIDIFEKKTKNASCRCYLPTKPVAHSPLYCLQVYQNPPELIS